MAKKKAPHQDRIPGGLADDMCPEDFDQAQLKKGIKIEMEHTSDRETAREIAMDHLSEDPKYYEKLAKMEGSDNGKKSGGFREASGVTEEQFIQRICSHPGDDLAVGIYGDWLEEQGSPEAERVRNFRRGLPLSNDFYRLTKQLQPEQLRVCMILLAKNVLPIFEAAVPDNPAPAEAIAAAEDGTVTQEIFNNAYAAAVDAAADAAYAAYAAYAAAYAAYAAADAAYAAYAAYAAAYAADAASQVYPDKHNTYLLVFSSFILFGCNAVVLD